jgi:hypothetical protein
VRRRAVQGGGHTPVNFRPKHVRYPDSTGIPSPNSVGRHAVHAGWCCRCWLGTFVISKSSTSGEEQYSQLRNHDNNLPCSARAGCAREEKGTGGVAWSDGSMKNEEVGTDSRGKRMEKEHKEGK